MMVKALRNGNFMMQECKTYDVVEISPQFKEMKRIKGVPGPQLENEAMRNTRHSHDENILPWIKGNGDLSLITLKDMSHRDIRNFFGKNDGSELMPLLCVCSSTGDKVFGVAMHLYDVKLCYHEKNSTKYTPLKEVFQKCRFCSISRNDPHCGSEHGQLCFVRRGVY